MRRWILKHRPTGPVLPGHVGEARRAWKAATARPGPTAALGLRHIDDDALTDALWAARAVGALVDALADTRTGHAPERLRFPRVDVIQGPPPPPGAMLLAVCFLEPGSEVAEVRFLAPPAAGAPTGDAVAVVRFAVDYGASEVPADVSFQRFRVGPPGRTRSSG